MDLLNNDIIFNIFNLLDISNKLNFIIINKNNYNLFKEDIQKCIILKLLLKNNYEKFYYLLNKYNYGREFNNYLLNIAVSNIGCVWVDYHCGIYDLRYIFEIIFKESCINENIIKQKNFNFYLHFYKILKKCIIYNNRSATLININNENMLSSLHNNFNFYPKGNYLHYTKLIY